LSGAQEFFATNDLPTLSIEATQPLMREDGTQVASVTLRRIGPVNQALIAYVAYAGSATVFDDYRTTEQDLPDWVVIPAGADAMALTLYAPDDDEPEPTETVEISLLPDPAYNIGFPSRTSLKILDNDLGILRIARNENATITLTWTSEQGRSYQAFFKNSLNEPNWLPLSPALGDAGGSITWTDSTAGASGQRFYSVQKLP
jgi:hypothetical protein